MSKKYVTPRSAAWRTSFHNMKRKQPTIQTRIRKLAVRVMELDPLHRIETRILCANIDHKAQRINKTEIKTTVNTLQETVDTVTTLQAQADCVVLDVTYTMTDHGRTDL